MPSAQVASAIIRHLNIYPCNSFRFTEFPFKFGLPPFFPPTFSLS